MTADLSGPLVLELPILLALISVFAWTLWSRPAAPPRFHGYAVRQGWQVDPIAVLDQDLRQGRLTGGILAVRDRLLIELTQHHGLELAQIRRKFSFSRVPRTPEVTMACEAVRALEATYSVAYRAENPLLTDLWTRWRRPVWREQARRQFEKELSDVENLWPALETSS